MLVTIKGEITMLVTIKIAQDPSSPTKKVWGYIWVQDTKDMCVFYGPGTKAGGHKKSIAAAGYVDRKYQEKLRKGYTEMVSETFDTTAVAETADLENMVEGLLSKIRMLSGDICSQHPASAMNYILSLKQQSPSLFMDHNNSINEASRQISGPQWGF